MLTSYYANHRSFPKDKKPVSISIYPPKWFPCEQDLTLAPTEGILKDYKDGKIDEQTYVKRYKEEVLSKLDPKEVYEKHKDSILICYEKTGDFCHRHIVADWLRDYGYIVEEITKKHVNRKPVNYLVLSDIHLGISKPPSNLIIEHLYKYFKKHDKTFRKLDAIFIDGDLLDKLLSAKSKEWIEVQSFFIWLLQYCKKYDIYLRILHGTPSHDWNQVATLDSLNKDLNIYDKFKYINTLSIERIEELDLNILYVPDEWRHDPKETFEEVKQLLKEHNLQEVDITHMHGQFSYQLPDLKLLSSHNEDDYLNITKYVISIGHTHTFSQYGRIIAQGSFDRLAHNEEEDKGGVIISIDNSGIWSYKRIINDDAVIFKTIDVVTEDIDEALTYIEKQLVDVPYGSYIRIRLPHGSGLKINSKDIRDHFLEYNIDINSKKDKSDKKKESLITKPVISTISITPENIKELLTERMIDKLHTEQDKKIYKEELNSILA